jgi:diaminopimelate decarboxylase
VRRVGLDAGMNALMRPALYDAWHDIENLSRQGGYAEAAFDVVGPICESSDVFGKRRKLPVSTAPDDVMLIADAGAYGYVDGQHLQPADAAARRRDRMTAARALHPPTDTPRAIARARA